MRKNYIWTAEIEPTEEGKFTVWLGEEGSSGEKYENVTAEEIGNILTEDIKAVSDVWKSNDDNDEVKNE